MIRSLVFEWLNNEKNGPWLMVLDNADDASLFHQPFPRTGSETHVVSERPLLCQCIPQKPHGRILVTSRDRTSAYNIVGNYDRLIQILPMEKIESLSLLKGKVSIHAENEHQAYELLDVLEFISLAITQAAAFIKQCEPLMTISTYVLEFRKSHDAQGSLLNKDSRDLRRDPTVPNSIITTWEISFNRLRKDHEMAADLLSMMCMFNRQTIPEDLIRGDESHLEFLNSVGPLMDYSLVSVGAKGNLFEMHRLVRLATLRWLESSKSLHSWQVKATGSMRINLPRFEFECLEAFRLLLPHAEEVLAFSVIDREPRLQHAWILRQIGHYRIHTGQYGMAAQTYQDSLNLRQELLKNEDELILGYVHFRIGILPSRQDKGD